MSGPMADQGPLLIGISAKAGCGKTTFANLLCQEHGFVRVSFADALKEECSQFTGLPLVYFNSPELKGATVEVPFGKIVPRSFMQIWGTEFRRASDPNYWLQALGMTILNLSAKGYRKIVVDDVRFRNEADFIRQQGGLLIRLIPYSGYYNEAGNHRSETDLDGYGSFDIVMTPEFGKIPEAVERLAAILASRGPERDHAPERPYDKCRIRQPINQWPYDPPAPETKCELRPGVDPEQFEELQNKVMRAMGGDS